MVSVPLGGHTERYDDTNGHQRVRWVPNRVVKGVASDTPISGYANDTANLLRLWKAEACESFDFEAFNVGDYYRAVEHKVASENITKVLYPNDEPLATCVLTQWTSKPNRRAPSNITFARSWPSSSSSI